MTPSIEQRAREAAESLVRGAQRTGRILGTETTVKLLLPFFTAQHAEDVAAGENKTLMLKLWMKNCDNSMARGEMCQMTNEVLAGIEPKRLKELTMPSTQPTQPCPKCGSVNTSDRHAAPSFALPETDFKQCDDCDHQWNHQ